MSKQPTEPDLWASIPVRREQIKRLEPAGMRYMLTLTNYDGGLVFVIADPADLAPLLEW